jgi:formylglycine-generating enzyme required for sulfatase activity
MVLVIRSQEGTLGEAPVTASADEAKRFYILEHEVSNKQWLEFLDFTSHPPPLCDVDGEGTFAYNQRHAWRGRAYPPGGGGLPVVFVTKEEAELFCQWRTERTGIVHRLPTDEEWSATAGPTRYPWGDSVDRLMNVPLSRSMEAGPDPFYVGTHDNTPSGVKFMLGNVQEFTSTAENGLIVLRGCAFDTAGSKASLQARTLAMPTVRGYRLGFRYVVPMMEDGTPERAPKQR